MAGSAGTRADGGAARLPALARHTGCKVQEETPPGSCAQLTGCARAAAGVTLAHSGARAAERTRAVAEGWGLRLAASWMLQKPNKYPDDLESPTVLRLALFG